MQAGVERVRFLSRAEELPQTPTELGDSHNKVMPLKTADAEHKTGHGKSENKSTQWGHRTHTQTQMSGTARVNRFLTFIIWESLIEL